MQIQGTAGHNVVRMSRWLRCLYQVALSAPSSDASINFLLAKACSIADSASRPPSSHANSQAYAVHPLQVYPPEELEFLAITTFNRAVDAFCACDKDTCDRLAEQAMDVASRLNDDGALKAVLSRNHGMLKWD